jgi:superfamily I DNA/RNA helicase
VKLFSTPDQEATGVGTWLERAMSAGVKTEEIGVCVRSDEQLEQARRATSQLSTGSGTVTTTTMHAAKGLGFRAVVVMACDEDVIPSLKRIEQVGDEADLEEAYTTERNLLYVACTRARERLLRTAVAPGSEFPEDLEV